MNETNALQKIEPMPPVAVNPTVEAMITLAVERGASVDTIERLMAIRREVRAEQAKEAFDRAMSAFQAECPVIHKTKAVPTDSGGIAYKYAPIESIVSQVKELLRNHGFSYSTRMELGKEGVKATVRVTHESGHSEESAMEVPFGNKTKVMSQSQVAAAATTFAKRYAFLNAFGILTGDEDNDGMTDNLKKEPTSDNAKGSQGQERPRTSDNAVRGKKGEILTKPPVATEDQRVRWVKQLKAIEDKAVAYGYAEGILLPPGDNFPGEPIECWPLNATPTTKRQAVELFAKIQAFEMPQKPAGTSGPPSTSHSPQQNASGTAMQANRVAQSESSDSQDGPEAQPWFNAVVPVPYAGMKRDEYLKKPDTIGELYNARHDDEQARRRLFGFLHNFEPKGWTGRDGKPRPPSDSDKKFRDDLDAFGEWFEENHPDEAEND